MKVKIKISQVEILHWNAILKEWTKEKFELEKLTVNKKK